MVSDLKMEEVTKAGRRLFGPVPKAASCIAWENMGSRGDVPRIKTKALS
jgi:hypothetical protein